MNVHAGIREGNCQHRGCLCAAYEWTSNGDQRRPSCVCSHERRWHAQVWRDRPLVTTANWDVGAA